jgi:hypothetical protein
VTLRIIYIAVSAVLIAGCGIREPLRPADGASLPAAPPLATRALTTDELLAVPTEFRPLRVDEPLTRSERRPVDRFDLPPPEVGGATEGEPSELEEEPEPAKGNPPQ